MLIDSPKQFTFTLQCHIKKFNQGEFFRSSLIQSGSLNLQGMDNQTDYKDFPCSCKNNAGASHSNSILSNSCKIFVIISLLFMCSGEFTDQERGPIKERWYLHDSNYIW